MSMGGFFACCLNLVTTKYVLPVTSYLTLYILGFIMTSLALLNLYFLTEKLDFERLARNGALELPKSKIEKKDLNSSQYAS